MPSKPAERIPAVIRFWHYWNGDWVRLTIRNDETLTLSHGERTDEGYERRDCTIECLIDQGTGLFLLDREDYWTARDCDGPHSTTHRYSATKLTTFDDEVFAVFDVHIGEVPDWKLTLSAQRDHFAEAAGY